MADAQITIDGRVATDPRYNNVNGKDVANLRVLAGRSKKLDDGSFETLSQTAYDVAFWGEHAYLVDKLNPQKGDSVKITGTVTGLSAYDGQNGQSLSAKVSGDGVRVFPKRQQSGGFGQQSGGFGGQQNTEQGPTWGQEHQPQGQQNDPWAAQEAQGDSRPPF